MENLIKKIFKIKLVMVLSTLALFLSSCISVEYNKLTDEETARTEKLGPVKDEFRSFNILHIYNSKDIGSRAHGLLLSEARKNYTGNIDVVNIEAKGSMGATDACLTMVCGVALFNMQTVTATGTVVRSRGGGGGTQSSSSDFSSDSSAQIDSMCASIAALFKAEKNKSVTVAVLDFSNMDGKQSALGVYLADQTTNYLFKNAKSLKIVERAQIGKVLKEIEFGQTGLVDAESAMKIGKMVGANSVVVGTITKIGGKSKRVSVVVKIIETESGALLSSGTTELRGDEYIEMYDQIVKKK